MWQHRQDGGTASGCCSVFKVTKLAQTTRVLLQAQLLLESAQAMKSRAARDGAFATLAACALRYGQLEAVAGASIAALTRNEHLANVLAELAEFCEAKYHDERLVCSAAVLSTSEVEQVGNCILAHILMPRSPKPASAWKSSHNQLLLPSVCCSFRCLHLW